MTKLDLDELERAARVPTGPWRSWNPTLSDPQTILALIDRVKRAEAVITEALARKEWVEDHGWMVPAIDLAEYQNGADQP